MSIQAKFTHNVEQSLARLRDELSEALDISDVAVMYVIKVISSLVTSKDPMGVLQAMPGDEFRNKFLNLVGDAAIIGIAKAVEAIEDEQ